MDAMQKFSKKSLDQSEAGQSNVLSELVTKWEEIQKQIDALQTFEDLSSHTDRPNEIDALEQTLQEQQNRVTREIVDVPCGSVADMLLKLNLWQRSQCLGNADLSGFSLTEQIGLSINTEAFL